MPTSLKHTASVIATPDPRAPWPSPRGRLLKSSEVRSILAIGPTTFWRLVGEGKLRMVKLGQGHGRVDGDSVDVLMRGATASSTATAGN